MNNWDQYQSTPKLLPPTVFEKTNNSANTSSSNNNTQSDFINEENNVATNAPINNSSSLSTTKYSNESYLIASGESQFIQLSNELEKLKFEIRKLHSENESLRHKNRGKLKIQI
jgi:hypothetical protein